VTLLPQNTSRAWAILRPETKPQSHPKSVVYAAFCQKHNPRRARRTDLPSPWTKKLQTPPHQGGGAFLIIKGKGGRYLKTHQQSSIGERGCPPKFTGRKRTINYRKFRQEEILIYRGGLLTKYKKPQVIGGRYFYNLVIKNGQAQRSTKDQLLSPAGITAHFLP